MNRGEAEMKVDLSVPNPGFQALRENNEHLIVVDANFFLPPNRSRIAAHAQYSFELYRDVWIAPMHRCFPNLAIHETVLSELVDHKPSQFANARIHATSEPRLLLLRDNDLTEMEDAVRNTKEQIIAKYT